MCSFLLFFKTVISSSLFLSDTKKFKTHLKKTMNLDPEEPKSDHKTTKHLLLHVEHGPQSLRHDIL